MNNLSSATALELVQWGTVLLVLLLCAAVGVGIVRKKTMQDEGHPLDPLSNFQEMRKRGDISDAEFRTITSVLGGKPRPPVQRDEEQG